MVESRELAGLSMLKGTMNPKRTLDGLYVGVIALVCAFPLLLLTAHVSAKTPKSFSSYAIVQKDSTLRIRNRKVHLYGIYVPRTTRQCETAIRPVRCGSSAMLALDRKIGANFVRCYPKIRHTDRSITAACFVDDEDLSAYLISRGHALARDTAPFEYIALERIARNRHRGLWGRTFEDTHRHNRY